MYKGCKRKVWSNPKLYVAMPVILFMFAVGLVFSALRWIFEEAIGFFGLAYLKVSIVEKWCSRKIVPPIGKFVRGDNA